jgi:hypothetical protein
MFDEADVPHDGAALDAGAPGRAWEAFKRFGAMPVEGMSPEEHSDGLLFQAGYMDGLVEPTFFFDMTRQFIFHDADGEYDGMEQLSCTFSFEPLPELRPLSVSVWSFDLSLDGFYELVEELPAFRVPVDGGFVPVRVEVNQGPV